MATTTKKVKLATAIKADLENKMPLDQVTEKVAGLVFTKKLVEDIPFNTNIIEEQVLKVANELGLLLDDSQLLETAKEAVKKAEKLPKTYTGMLKLAESLAAKVYNKSEDFVPKLKMVWTGTFPKQEKLGFRKNSLQRQAYEILINNPKITREQYLEKLISELRNIKEGVDPKPISTIQATKYYKLIIANILIFKEMLESMEVETILNMLTE